MNIEQDFVEAAQYLALRLQFWSTHKAFLTPIIQHVDSLEGSCTVNAREMDISVSGNMGTLIGMLSYLEDLGYTPKILVPEQPTPYFTSFLEGDGLPRLWFSFSSKTCRKVQIGTQTVEQPIYEIQCGDEA
jgi:hypothetical protein